jgi:hypothetical protein
LRRNFGKHVTGICVMLFSFMYTANAQKLGDNLGNHKAKDTLRMGNNYIVNAKGIAIGSSTLLNDYIGLQLDSADKAILIPRIQDTALIPGLFAINGMMVFQLKDATFYVHQGSESHPGGVIGHWATFGSFSNASGVTTLNGSIGNLIIGSGFLNGNPSNTGISIVKNGDTLKIIAQNTSAIWNANRLMGKRCCGYIAYIGPGTAVGRGHKPVGSFFHFKNRIRRCWHNW